MKCVILLFVLFFGLNVFAQKDSSRWDLNKYVWSHAQTAQKPGQKPPIDFDAIDNWQGYGDYISISRNGKYFAYCIEKGSGLNSEFRAIDSLVVQSTTASWRQSFAGIKPGFFACHSRCYIYLEKETLCFLQTGGSLFRYVQGVDSYKLPENGKNEWLVYQLKGSVSNIVLEDLRTGKEKRFTGTNYSFDNSSEWLVCQINSNNDLNESKDLLLYQLATGNERRFQNVASYLFANNGKALLLTTRKRTERGIITALQYVSLQDGRIKSIWSATGSDDSIINPSFDGLGRQIVFSVQENSISDQEGLARITIWYYKDGMNKAILKVNDLTQGIKKHLLIQNLVSFTDNGRYIRFSLQSQLILPKPDADAVYLDVWSYKDLILQSSQPHILKEPKIYTAIIGVESDQVIQLEEEGKTLYLLQGDYAIVKRHSSDKFGDRFWEQGYGFNADSNWLVCLRDGYSRLLPTKGWEQTLWFSPSGNYLVFFDAKRGCHYFSYDLRTHKVVNISIGVPNFQLGRINPYIRPNKQPEWPVDVAGWIEMDNGLLVYDNYDIWKLDLSGKEKAVNLTNGFGASHQIVFNLMDGDSYSFLQQPIVPQKGTLILKAFNRQNKYNGFYRISIGKANDPVLLFAGPCFMQNMHILINGFDNKCMQPLKASDAPKWIVQRQTAIDAPNYFATSDFKYYRRLTNLQPQSKYKWLTAELVSFKQLDGTMSKGVLYKPEDFDSTKKYPVIISFYSQLSDRIYQYPVPKYVNSPEICNNPAWMTSHGYLVFMPDIYFRQGQWGPSTVNTVDAVTQYLRALTYVDGKYIGAVGHSNSGRLGYYLATHSHCYAAMVIGSGTTNIISGALSLNSTGKEESSLEWAEVTSLGTGLGILWENKVSWLDHASVLHADDITCPILMYACKKNDIPVSQAIEMFTALRRLEKKVWWLQYDQGGHRLGYLKDQRDFTIRYTQYFDHYLKQAPAPSWMTQGIHASMKGIAPGYNLDPSGTCAMKERTRCEVCEKWNEQYRRTPEMFTKPVSEWRLATNPEKD